MEGDAKQNKKAKLDDRTANTIPPMTSKTDRYDSFKTANDIKD